MSDSHLSEYLEFRLSYIYELNYEYVSNTILLIYTSYWCTRDRIYDTIEYTGKRSCLSFRRPTAEE